MHAGESQNDSPWDAMRSEMVETQLAGRGIRDPRVLVAMGQLPREQFVPQCRRAAAYEDRALPVGPGQTISQPYIVAYMTEALRMAPGHRVLEVGGGTGYQAALLSMLGGEVVSVESDPHLVETARERLANLNITGVRFHCGDGSLGFAQAAPFDRIMVTAGAPRVPPSLVEQLVEGGHIIIPVGSLSRQMLVRVIKRKRGTIELPLLPCRFVKLVGEQGWE
ncbi:MAG: protein-L-isoaspartate(D-aspartate) O-methyltransferase [Phycisphaerae bacterium]|nr:protein-L-isoaspartate(D-aspartate) O-methyltransferase [Phycisphaerae bacterium]